jgi:uncharacterized lipoprotein YddW (UPF0748 family)
MFKLNIFLIFAAINTLVFSQNPPKFEMRGLWVATVKNIDWPSSSSLSAEAQQKEAISLIDKAVSLGFNAIFLQVRPASDAFYHSTLEPTSEYLTGKSGRDASYDALSFWIAKAHEKGIELHAWINPFRASMSVNDNLAPTHPVKLHPQWFITYNNRYQYDPGNPECRTHIAKVVSEIVDNYNIDGIHLDDYFYPYPKAGETFNDDTSFQDFNPYHIADKSDWRRWNVDQTIVLIRNAIKSKKEYVAFGVSPFGVWRNKTDDPIGSDTHAGITNYDHLYADILYWLKEDWIDYVAPQIYWDTEHKTANYKVLVDWWSLHSQQKPIFIGHSLYRLNSDPAPWDSPNEMIEQIKIARSKPNTYGSIFFSASHLNRDLKGFQDSLSTKIYKYPALVPNIVETLQPISESAPIKLRKRGRFIKWKYTGQTNDIKKFVVYAYQNKVSNPENNASNIIAITPSLQLMLDKQKYTGKSIYFKVSAIDNYNREIALSYPKSIKFK